MVQTVLPIFPAGATEINTHIGFQEMNDTIYYFHGTFPIFSHNKYDLNSFRYITSQLVVSGNVKQAEVIKAFGVTSISVKRSVKLFKEKGLSGFTKIIKGGISHVLVPEVLQKIQDDLDRGITAYQIAKNIDIKISTIRKAIGDGRLKKKLQPSRRLVS